MREKVTTEVITSAVYDDRYHGPFAEPNLKTVSDRRMEPMELEPQQFHMLRISFDMMHT